MHHVCNKVYPAIRGVQAKSDRLLSERCRLLRGKLTPSAVGVPREYECRYPSTLAHLRLIDSLDTPLEILYTIQDAMVSPGLQFPPCPNTAVTYRTTSWWTSKTTLSAP